MTERMEQLDRKDPQETTELLGHKGPQETMVPMVLTEQSDLRDR
jgi:hypothetical protein